MTTRSPQTDPSVILVASTKTHNSDGLVLLINDYMCFPRECVAACLAYSSPGAPVLFKLCSSLQQEQCQVMMLRKG